MRLIPFALLLSLVLFPLAAQADELEELLPHHNERDYIIELLVFTQTPGPGATELPGEPKVFKPLESAAYMLGPSPYWAHLSQGPLQIYQPRELQLTDHARALERSDDYRLLFHDAWQMPVVAEDRSLPLLLEAGDYYGGQPELIGQLQLSVARYLHLETDLYLHSFEPLETTHRSAALTRFLNQNRSSLGTSPQLPALTDQAAADQDGEVSRIINQEYQIKESAQMRQRRRMRSGELHFIDSPYLGILVKIERAPEEDKDEKEPDSARR
ncbi:CsiV family protein [Marinospirillum sp.]|uniref:CsiV family protein n=1 Tax=Marinospirillum sp. TaxID=2183934 RepID=UPI003850A688